MAVQAARILTADLGTHWAAYTSSLVYVAYGDTREDALARLALLIPDDGSAITADPFGTAPLQRAWSAWRGRRQWIFERDGFACLLCGALDNLTIDHVIPRAHGGTNKPENLQSFCWDCNHNKGDRL